MYIWDFQFGSFLNRISCVQHSSVFIQLQLLVWTIVCRRFVFFLVRIYLIFPTVFPQQIIQHTNIFKRISSNPMKRLLSGLYLNSLKFTETCHLQRFCFKSRKVKLQKMAQSVQGCNDAVNFPFCFCFLLL